NFDLRDLDGAPYPATRLLGRPTVLVLLRHLGCLFCQEHLSRLRDHDQEIAGAGGRVAVVSFAGPEHVRRFALALGHPYLWLSDPERSCYRALGVGRGGALNPFSFTDLWRNAYSTLRGQPWIPQQADLWQLGADFVFDADGQLTLAYRCRSSHDRPSSETVLEAFRKAARPARTRAPR
ncbi:MAG: AhpC/TSA family protein, partial [Chloroflexi bacterium]